MVLKESKLIKHQIYFFQSKFGVQWIMPISEQNWDGDRVDVIASVSFNDLLESPKCDSIKDYLILGKVPKDKYGIELYKHYSIKISSLDDDILIPFDVLELDYPNLFMETKKLDKYCIGITKEKESQYKREIKLKLLLNG